MPSSGLTSPVTLAGSVIQQNAENLSFVTLAQLTSPGTPTIPYSSPGITNMKTGNVIYGAVEVALQCAAMSQIYSHYGIPFTATVGLTDSKTHDEQAAYERALSVMLTALAGPSMFLCSGALNALTETSFEQLLIDDEILGMVSRAVSGIRVDDETMGLDTIAEVGPTGHFLGQKHTIDFLMKEHYLPKLAHRDSRTEWEERGSKDIIKRARERAKEILRTHETKPLEDHVRKRVESIVDDAWKRHQKA
jgi:trimethylamine--corrinoid protein Co-methyltransferase